MKITIELNPKWLAKEVNDRRLKGEPKVTPDQVKMNRRVANYVTQVAKGLLLQHFDQGKDEGELGEIAYETVRENG